MMKPVFPRSLLLLLLLLASGLGACVQSEDNTCTRNSDCSDPNAQCVNGRCTVECVEDRDCLDGFSCQQGACTEQVRTCRTDDDCVFGEECQNGECVKVEGYCERNGDCPDGYVCRGETSTCIPVGDNNSEPECTLNSDCASDEICEDGACVDAPVEEPDCQRDSDCPSGMRCASGVCIDECAQDRDCGDGEVCDGGRCVEDSSTDDCRVDASLCTAAQECCDGACVTRGQCGGGTCTENPSLCQPSEECCEGSCVPRGQCGGAGDYWAVCTARAQCSTELCIGDPQTGQGHCTERCNFRQDCPSSPNSLCIQSYHALAQAAPEISGICFADDTGTVCQNAGSCFDSLCLVRQDPNGGLDQRCTVRCQTSSDCLPGYGCGPVSFDTGNGQPTAINVCTPLGSTCSGSGSQAADQCFTGVCLTDDNTNVGYCTSWCLENGACPAGWECTPVAQDASVCVRQ